MPSGILIGGVKAMLVVEIMVVVVVVVVVVRVVVVVVVVVVVGVVVVIVVIVRVVEVIVIVVVVIPIIKKGWKIIEKIVFTQLSDYLIRNKLLDSYQSDYTRHPGQKQQF